MTERERHTMDELLAIVENEGLGYAITSYTSPERMPTPELEALWKTAGDAMNQIEEILERFAEETYGDT